MSMRYNTDLMAQEDLDSIESVWDYVDPKWAGRIVALSPLNGGADDTYYEAYVHPDIGKEWVDAFVDPALDVSFTDNLPFLVNSIATGKFHFGIAVGPSAEGDLDSLAALGAPVERFPCTVADVCVKEMREGGVLSGAGSLNNMVVLADEPHPNATKLFVNWFLSQEGQSTMHQLAAQESDQTLRTDVTDFGKTRDFERRDNDRDYFFFSADLSFLSQREEALQHARDAYNAAQ